MTWLIILELVFSFKSAMCDDQTEERSTCSSLSSVEAQTTDEFRGPPPFHAESVKTVQDRYDASLHAALAADRERRLSNRWGRYDLMDPDGLDQLMSQEADLFVSNELWAKRLLLWTGCKYSWEQFVTTQPGMSKWYEVVKDVEGFARFGYEAWFDCFHTSNCHGGFCPNGELILDAAAHERYRTQVAEAVLE